MRYFCYVFLSCFCTCILQAQQSKIDSLQKVLLTAKEDTAKINILNILAMELRNSNPDTAVYYAEQVLSLSERIDLKLEMAKAHLWKGIAITNLGNYEEALKQFSKAKVLFEQLLSISRTDTKTIKMLMARTLNAAGLVYEGKSDFEVALKNYEESLKIRIETGDKKGEADSYNNMGIVYTDQNNYPEALRNHFAALKIRTRIGDKSGEADSYNGIGNIYIDQGNYPEALKNHFASLKIRKEMNDKDREADSYNNIGNIYYAQGSYDAALRNYLMTLEIWGGLGDKAGVTYSYTGIGLVNYKKGNYSEALKNFFTALKIQEEIGYKLGVSESYLHIAEVYRNQGDISKAADYAQKSLTLARELGVILDVRNASQSLYEDYKAMKNYRMALQMHELVVQSQDSMINEKNEKEILNQQFKYDYDKKALADSLNFVSQKNISDLKNEAERKTEQTKRYTLYAGLSLVLIFSMFISNRFRVTRRQKEIIEHQNSQIVESINYSKKIQASLLPSLEVMQKSFPGLFVLYEPKDIVSGDFYWFKEFEKYAIMACVDCTGHGVPGGFMSTLGSLLMDKIVNEESASPSEILSNLSKEIISVLRQQDGGEIQDGMDLSVCLIDKVNKTIEFSGARNGIVIVSKGAAKRYKADLYPVGGNYMKKGKPIDRQFQTRKIVADKNDWIYMYTDGFMEQSGGDKGLPMNYTQFENHLIAISNILHPEEKLNTFRTQMDSWRGTHERSDDVLIMGFQVL